MFYLDLDELDHVFKKIFLVSRDRANVYSFRDDDHMQYETGTLRDNVSRFVKSKGVDQEIHRIMLLTNLRTFGYLFNPVSFYYCFDRNDNPVCVVPEIGNTFGELKPYIIKRDALENKTFKSQQKKYFYISPFIDLDVPLDFQLMVPDDHLKIQIDDFDEQGKFLYATLTGRKLELNNKNLLMDTLKFPFVTLRVIGMIHFHAMILYFKRLPYHAKEDNPQLQRNVLRAWNKK